MKFDKRKYSNRVKVMPPQFKNLYDFYLQEFLPDKEGSMLGEDIGPKLICASRTIWFTVHNMMKGIRISPINVSEDTNGGETIIEESLYGDVSFGWDSPYAPTLWSRDTISPLGSNRPFQRMTVSIKPSSPESPIGATMFASLEDNDYELPQEEALFIDLCISPRAFQKMDRELSLGRVAGASISLKASNFRGLYTEWSPVHEPSQNLKVLASRAIVVNPEEFPVRFGKLSGTSRDFGLTLLGPRIHMPTVPVMSEPVADNDINSIPRGS